MTNALSLSPLFRQTVGFDRFNDLFETVAAENNHKPSFPPYDIVKVSEHDYHITMAIAGYDESDITITVENDTLTVAAAHDSQHQEDESTELVYLHRGIAKRNFSQKFRLADHMKVTGADMTNGLLTVSVTREIPEEKKPQTIQINSKNHLN